MSTSVALFLLLSAAQAPPPSPVPTPTPDPWAPIRFMAGEWEGESEGEPGTGTVRRTYTFVLSDRFLNERNVSTYPPQPKKQKGEVHHHWSFFSYDRARRTLVLRQFHQEGFVNQFAMAASAAAPGTILFESEALENIPKGWKARETYQIVSPDEFVETFELATNGSYEVYSRNRFKRKSTQVADEERRKLAPLPRLFEALDAKPGARIADVGSGDGFYTMQLASVVTPGGRVTASDIDPVGLGKLKSRIESAALTNIDVVVGRPDDPLLTPNTFDAALIRNAYHEMIEHEAILRHIRNALKPGGRLVVVEPIHERRRALSRKEQVAVHEIASEIVAAELVAAGFEIHRLDETFDPSSDTEDPGRFWLIVALKSKEQASPREEQWTLSNIGKRFTEPRNPAR